MTGKIQKYADATLLDFTRVVDAADRLYASVAEFPDDPACWSEWMEALDKALESCPGTSAHFHARKQQELPQTVTEAEQRFRSRYEADKCDDMTEEQWGVWVDALPKDEFWAMMELGLSDKPVSGSAVKP
jgi:hypothetical protein